MAHTRRWAHCTPILQALSFRFEVCCDDASLGSYVDDLLASLREPGEDGAGGAGSAGGDGSTPSRYELTRAAAGSTSGSGSGSEGRFGVAIHRDGELVESQRAPGDAVAYLLWDINRLAAERSGRHLLFHSGGLEVDGTGILVPAASGSGKSTLTAGLARAGFGYLSDELVAYELEGADGAGAGGGRGLGRLLPYPKPITVKPGSFSVLASMEPGPFGDGWFSESYVQYGAEWQVPVGERTGRRVGAPCPPRYVIVPHYDPGAETALTRLNETEAFFTLALHAVNMLPHGAAGPEAIGRLAAGCECYTLAHSDLDEACEVVLGLTGARV